MNRDDRARYLALLRPYRGAITLVVILSVVQALALLPVPLLLGIAIDEALPEGRKGLLGGIVAIMAGLAVVSVGVGIVARWRDLTITKSITRGLRVDILERIFALPRRSFDQTSVATMHDRLVNDSTRVDGMTSVVLTRLLPDAVVAIGITIILVFLDWRLTLVTLAFAPVLVAVSRVMLRRVRPLADAFHGDYASFSERTMLQIRSQDLIRVAGAERDEIASSKAHYETVRKSSTRVAVLASAHGAIQQGIIAVAASALLLAGGLAVINESMTLGELLSFYAAFAMLRGPVGAFARSYGAIVDGQRALHRIGIFLDDPAVRPYRGDRQIELRGSLELRNVTFGYDPSRPVIENLDLRLEPGSTTALVGPNGSGKSSVVHVLLGFYRPDAGEVFADGISFDEIDLIGLRRQLGVVRQEPFLIPGTIRDNVVYGRDVTEDQLLRALDMSGTDTVVAGLPDGLDTMVGEDGALLSGGQRQRIAIARALAGEPSVLILDEPTNHLDEGAIANLLTEIKRLGDDLAILLISHQRSVTDHVEHVVTL